MQSAVFTGRVARQTNRLYVLRIIAKLVVSPQTVVPLAAKENNSLQGGYETGLKIKRGRLSSPIFAQMSQLIGSVHPNSLVRPSDNRTSNTNNLPNTISFAQYK